MKPIASLCAVTLTLAACVGDGVEFGGLDAPATSPASAVPCEGAGLKRVQDGRMLIPDEVVLFFVAAQTYQSVNSMKLAYDVNEAGQALNIRYLGPPEYLKHAARQKLIRAASDFLQTSLYAWSALPGFATGCNFELQYVIDWRRSPDGVVDPGRSDQQN